MILQLRVACQSLERPGQARRGWARRRGEGNLPLPSNNFARPGAEGPGVARYGVTPPGVAWLGMEVWGGKPPLTLQNNLRGAARQELDWLGLARPDTEVRGGKPPLTLLQFFGTEGHGVGLARRGPVRRS